MDLNKLRTLLRKRFVIPKERSIRRAMRSFTSAEKAVFYFFVTLFIFSGLVLLLKVNASFLEEVPTRGGSLREGWGGNPRFINPVLAISEADKNLVTLVYSGLVRFGPDGELINDLVESLEISKDGLHYTARIRPDALFHDGEPVTADDVVFTIQKVLDPLIKSPRRGNWDGVTISKNNEETVTFTLKKPYAPFIENLTLGILPKHIWNNVTNDEFAFSQFNTLPIGSGPYEVRNVERNSGGIPDYYELKPFERGPGHTPFIESLVFRFYPSEEALVREWQNGGVESFAGLTAERASELESNGAEVVTAPLPRVFAVFFNQNESEVLRDRSVREALNASAPRRRIVERVLGGYGTPIDSPLPPGLFPWAGMYQSAESDADLLARAAQILSKGGWNKNEEGVLEKKIW